MDVAAPVPLLGGLTPADFMRRYWQRKPLLVRQAWPGVEPPLTRAALLALAGRDGVESRLLTRFDGHWRLRHGPFGRRALPALNRPGWTLLVQGLDLHCEAAHAMRQQFRFVTEARLDDLMMSYASDGGGVGPHRDAYDVFLLQVQGRRRWRVGRVVDASLIAGLPVKILRSFEPDFDWVLAPGDLLYLPPMWGHDGIAEGECMTCSVGFRAPRPTELARDLMLQLADTLETTGSEPPLRDRPGLATASPGLVPATLRRAAETALHRALVSPGALDRALGGLLTEPKPQVWFEAGTALPVKAAALALDRRSRMMYDARHVYINGQAFGAKGRDARLLQQLADARTLDAGRAAGFSTQAWARLSDWAEAGWLHVGVGA